MPLDPPFCPFSLYADATLIYFRLLSTDFSPVSCTSTPSTVMYEKRKIFPSYACTNNKQCTDKDACAFVTVVQCTCMVSSYLP